MDPIAIGFISLAILFLLILLGVHIGFSLAILGVVGIWWTYGDFNIVIGMIARSSFDAIRDYNFVVLPLFILMGSFMSSSTVVKDLYTFMNRLLYKLPGSLGVATVSSNAVFSAITGVSVASASVFSKIAVPQMFRLNYRKSFAVGTVAGSSVLGMLIPPSVLLIVYGMLAEVSIGALFIAGIVPGIVLGSIFCIGIILMSVFTPNLVYEKNKEAITDDKSLVDEEEEPLYKLFIKVIPILILIMLVLGGIWTGYFTATEASAVGALGALIISITKGMNFSDFKGSLYETASVTSSILFLLITATIYARMLATTGISTWLSETIINSSFSPYTILFLFIVILILLGAVLDSTSILLLTIPLMAPAAVGMGFDLIWFGVVLIIVVEIGLLTPPFGMVCFAIKATLGELVKVEEIFRGAIPFILMMLLAIIILILFPPLVTWLPSKVLQL